PHFWALALYRTDDYARAGIPMLPVVAGDTSTRRQILLYTLILAPLGITPWLFGYTGALYGTTAAAAGAIMLALGWQVLRERRPAERASRNLFAFSILYLFLLFAVLLAERGWGGLVARLAA
ncbi:MAG: UbiA family prenyltransferase, partial [Pseudolabrys sp.]